MFSKGIFSVTVLISWVRMMVVFLFILCCWYGDQGVDAINAYTDTDQLFKLICRYIAKVDIFMFDL